MDQRVAQLRVGVVVVASGIITIILILLLGEMPNITRGHNTLYIKFDRAPGVLVDTPVRKSGILIGRVTHVELLDEGVLVTVRLDDEFTVRKNELPWVASESLLGDAVIEFVPSPDPALSTEPYVDGDYALGQARGDPFDVILGMEQDMAAALTSVQGAGEEVGHLARNLNSVVENNQDQFRRIMTSAEDALGSFQRTMQAIDEVVSDEELKQKLRDALEGVPALMEEAHETLAGIQRVTDAATVNLENLTEFTGPLAERGDAIAEEIESSLRQLDSLVSELVDFSQALNNREGTLRQLVDNPDLYIRLNQAADNVEQATRHLEPLLRDARVFMDKIARNPRQLGVQGALDRERSGLKIPRPMEMPLFSEEWYWTE
jgi:phospholipid/cholesterol/gamma-HCH transport system substrate-binding protein